MLCNDGVFPFIFWDNFLNNWINIISDKLKSITMTFWEMLLK